MFTTGSKLFLGATTLSIVATIVYARHARAVTRAGPRRSASSRSALVLVVPDGAQLLRPRQQRVRRRSPTRSPTQPAAQAPAGREHVAGGGRARRQRCSSSASSPSRSCSRPGVVVLLAVRRRVDGAGLERAGVGRPGVQRVAAQARAAPARVPGAGRARARRSSSTRSRGSCCSCRRTAALRPSASSPHWSSSSGSCSPRGRTCGAASRSASARSPHSASSARAPSWRSTASASIARARDGRRRPVEICASNDETEIDEKALAERRP